MYEFSPAESSLECLEQARIGGSLTVVAIDLATAAEEGSSQYLRGLVGYWASCRNPAV
jgi:hypothetical protein